MRAFSGAGHKTLISTILAALLIGMFSFAVVNAQGTDDPVVVSFSPRVIEVSANPGEPTIENNVRLTNGSGVPLEITTRALNFTADGEEGKPSLTEEETAFSLADWITVEPAVHTIEPNGLQDFTISIDVPADAEPGGHFGAVEFVNTPPKPEGAGDSFVGQVFNAVPLILVSVAGDITEEADIASFESSKSVWTDWSDDEPITLETRISNSGNVHFKPQGRVVIKNMFGGEVASLQLTDSNVLPESIRNIPTVWEDPGTFSFGRYTAEVEFVYGEESTILSSTTSFFIFPYKQILPVALLGFGTLFVLVKFRKRIFAAVKVLSGKS